MTDKNNGWADPGPAGAMALAIATFGFFAILTGRVEGSGIILMAMWLIGGFIIHMLIGVIKILSGDSVDGNVFTFFAAFLMLVAALEFIVKWMAMKNGWIIDTRISGYLWIPVWLTIWLWTPAIWKQAPFAFNIAVLAADIAFPIISLTSLELLAPSYLPIAGYSLLVTGILSLYVGGAGLLNPAFGKAIFPVGSPILKSTKTQSF